MSLRYTLRHLKGVDINLDNIKDWELACSEDTLKIYWRHGDVIEDVTKGAADYATEQAKTLTALINSFNADLAVELAKAEASATAAASSASSANDILLQNQSIKTAISTIENEINTLCSDTKKAASQVATDKTDIEAIQTDINTKKTAIDTKATEAATSATNAKTSETNAAASATNAKSSENVATQKAKESNDNLATLTEAVSTAQTQATNAAASATEAKKYYDSMYTNIRGPNASQFATTVFIRGAKASEM